MKEEEEVIDYIVVDMIVLKYISSFLLIYSVISVDFDVMKLWFKKGEDDVDKVFKVLSVYDKDSDFDEFDEIDGDEDFSDEEEFVVFEVVVV